MIIFLFLFLAEIYAIILVIYLIIQIARGKKLPMLIVAANVLSISLLLWLKNKVEDHEVIFTGSYQKPDDWGQGVENAAVTMKNLGVVYFALLVTQIIFVIFFSKSYRKMNQHVEPRGPNDLF